MDEALKPIEVLVYPERGRVRGIVITWEEVSPVAMPVSLRNPIPACRKTQARKIRFSEVCAVCLQAGYLTLEDTREKSRTIILHGHAAEAAWEQWNIWLHQNTAVPCP